MIGDALESIKNLGGKKIAIIGAAGVVLLIALIAVALTMSSGPMSPLYSNLSLNDSQKIVQELDQKAIPYELGGNGTQVLVPSDKTLRLRMEFAEQGIPSDVGATIGYEIFDKSEKLGTSSFVQNMNQLRALEGELSRTINAMEKIKNSRVHLVLPKNDLFKKDNNDPTASISLSMKGSEALSSGEIAAVRYLVSTAVPGLKASNVTIIDNRGILLARGGADENDPGVVASTSQEFKTGYENKMRSRIEDLLEKYVGLGNVRAQVNADIDFSREVTNSETYDPESQVARSVQTTEENEASTTPSTGGGVSVANNLPGAQANTGESAGGDKRLKTDEVTNYEISKTVKNLVSETGTVKKLSVAVMVDGTYQENPKTGEVEYTPRKPEEVAKLTELVKSAIGFDVKRGDVVDVSNLQFSSDFGGYKKEGMFDFLKEDFQSVVQILVMGLVAMMVILMVVRPLVKRALEVNAAQQAALEAAGGTTQMIGGVPVPQLAGPGGTAQIEGITEEDGEGFSALAGMKGPSKPASLKRINEIVEQNPDEAVNALRQWMYGENAA